MDHPARDAVSTTNDESVAYTYNARDQLILEQTDKQSTMFISADETIEQGYDPNGSLTSKEYYDDQLALTRTDTFAWDLRGRMVEAEVDGVVTEYGYDHAGQRVSQTTGGVEKRYLSEFQNPTGHPQIIEMREDDLLTTSYVVGLSIIAQADAQGTVYMLKDAGGSTRWLMSSMATAVAARMTTAHTSALLRDSLTTSPDGWWGRRGRCPLRRRRTSASWRRRTSFDALRVRG